MVEIRITSNPRFLTCVRALVKELCGLLKCSEEEQCRIVLAVDEACSNIIRHTYQGNPEKTIEISCRYLEDRLEIVLRDYGPRLDTDLVRPRDLDEDRPRDLDEIQPGGLGTHLIRTIMNEVEYSYEENSGNVLRMVKYINTKGR